MALHDVYRVIRGRRRDDGRRIDFEIEGDLGNGPERFTYTWDPDESGWPMADHLTSHLFSDPSIPIDDYVFVPPDRELLVLYLKAELKRLGVRDYVEREISTGGAEPMPQHIVDGAAYARATYNRFRDDPAAIPQDWREPKHWRLVQ